VRDESKKYVTGSLTGPFSNIIGRPTSNVKPQYKQTPSACTVNCSMRHDRGINQF